MATGTAVLGRRRRHSGLPANAFLRRAAALLGTLLVLIAAPAGAAPLSPDEEAGRAIFQDGESSFGDAFSGRLGIAQQQVPGTAARCANCHGPDGRGRSEGGVRPANIIWSELTKSYGHEHDNGRRHSPFDEASLKRALTQGMDPAGNPLDGVMPRMEISDRDFNALLAYLKKLEFLLDPGVSADTLTLGTLLPSAGRFGELGLAVKGILQAYIDTINKSGGIYGRRLELVVAEYSEDRAAATRELRKLITEGDIFALLSPFVPGIEQDLDRLANDAKIPVIGPLSLFSDDPRMINQYVFHLLSGVGELAEALALHVGNEPRVKANPVVLLHPDSASGSAVADAVEDWMKSHGWIKLSRIGFRPGAFDAAAIAKKIKARKAETVFLLGPGADVGTLANEAARFARPPLLLLPGPLVPRAVLDMPSALEGRILLAYPTIPADQKPDALSEYVTLFRDPAIARSHQTSQVPAYSSAVTLVEVLKRVGRDLTRQKLVSALETMQSFEPGLVPAVSFNAKRRLGAPGGYIIAPDLKNKNFRRLGGFVHLP
jgi:ABC-type branched-subunit amino acid transport system substrate-binding protein